jgi:hypothetical protein
MHNLPIARHQNVVVQELGKQILIYDLNTHKAFNLNETSSIVYQSCDGKTTLEELKLRTKFTEEIIFLALDELKKENLIEENQPYNSPFSGMSRREAIRKVGLASMIALPVISSLVAPTSAMAQSGGFVPGSRTLRQTCFSSTDCEASAPNCTNTPLGSSERKCCVGSVSYYDTGGVVNSCFGSNNCNSGTFACQSDANKYCCSGSATASCSGNSCACRCD